MMIFLSKVMEIFKKMDIRFILLIVVLGLLFFSFKQCQSNKNLKAEAERAEKINEQNQKALTDKIHEVENKAGEKEKVISSFVSKLGDLEKLNNNLYKEIKKEIGEVKGIISTSGGANAGGFSVDNKLEKIDNITYGLRFNRDYSEEGFSSKISGLSKFKLVDNNVIADQTDIIDNSIKFKLILGFKEEKDGSYNVFARSPSKKIEIDSLSGTLIIPSKPDLLTPPAPKKKKFGIGFYVGYGLDKKFTLSPQIGFGVQYNFIRF